MERKIAVVMPDNSLYWRAVAAAIEASREPGAEVSIIVPPISTGGSQATYLNGLLAEKPTVVIVNPLFPKQTTELSKTRSGEGGKLVAMDTPMPLGIPHVFVGHDQEEMCRTAENLLAPLLHDGDEIALLRMPGYASLAPREFSVIRAVKASGKKAAVHADIFGSTKREEDVAQARALLAKYPKTSLVVTTSNASSLDMLGVLLEDPHRGAAKFVGFGALPTAEVARAIESGVISAWISQNPRELGRKTYEVAAELAAGKTPSAVSIVATIVVRKENLNDPGVRSLFRP